LTLLLAVALFRKVTVTPFAPTVLAAEAANDGAPTTCSLAAADGPTSTCSSAGADDGDAPPRAHGRDHLADLEGRVVSLTDDTFDALTRTPAPGTWLIMFQSTSCGLCRKARSVLEELASDVQISEHNIGERVARGAGSAPPVTEDVDEDVDERGVPEGPVYAWEWEPAGEGPRPPRGPVYVATVEAASWSGRDTAARFDVDSVPTILLVHNKGYSDGEGAPSEVEPRSYYIYRGQRAVYPLRGFLLGGFAVRRRFKMPPPLPASQRKRRGFWGRAYDQVLSPSVRWAGSVVLKLFLAWFVFMSVVGLSLRVHHYAWGDDDAGPEARERELELEKARGRAEHEQQSLLSQDEKTARRQKIILERKAKNHERFAAKKEARRREKEKSAREGRGVNREEQEEEEMVGVGFAVKKSDIVTQTAKAKRH